MALRWKKEGREKGVAGVCQGPRGFDLMLDGVRVASVRFYQRTTKAWWSARLDPWLPIENTCRKPAASIEVAKEQAMTYVKTHLEAAIKSGAYVRLVKKAKP